MRRSVLCSLVGPLALTANIASPAQAAGRPDLVVASISAPTTRDAGQVLTVTSTVKNRGSRKAAASRVRTWLSTDSRAGNTGDRLLGTRFVPARPRGSSATGTTSYALPSTLRPGRWNLIVCADATRLVRESVETNNCRIRAVTVTTAPVPPVPNRAPIANDDTVDGTEDTVAQIGTATLLANDTDPDAGTTLTISDVSNPMGGTVTLSGSTITFTPTLNRVTPASFSYTTRDPAGLTDTAVVTVNLTPFNDAPVPGDDALVTPYQTDLVVGTSTLLANDTDVENDPLSVTQASNPAHGVVSLNGGTVTFTPDPAFSGTAGFDYSVSDGNLTAVGHVSITVGAPSTIVTSVATQTVTEGQTAQVGVSLSAQPLGSTTITVSSSDTTVFTVSPTTLTFTPANWNTPQNVNVTGVQDLDLAADAATLSLTSPAATTRQVGVTVNDDDTQSIVVSPAAGLTMNEGSSATLSVHLAFQPSSNVTLMISSNNTPVVNVITSTLTFTPANYATDMSVFLQAPNNPGTADGGATLTFSTSSGQVLHYNVSVTNTGS